MQGPHENLAAPWQPIPMATNGMGFFSSWARRVRGEWGEKEGVWGWQIFGRETLEKNKNRKKEEVEKQHEHTYTHTHNLAVLMRVTREREIQTVTTLWVKGDLPPGWSQQALRSAEERCGVVFWGEKETLRLKMNEKVITFCEMVQLRKLQCRCFMHTGY